MNNICNGIIADERMSQETNGFMLPVGNIEYKSTALHRLDNFMLLQTGLCTLKKMLLMGRKH